MKKIKWQCWGLTWQMFVDNKPTNICISRSAQGDNCYLYYYNGENVPSKGIGEGNFLSLKARAELQNNYEIINDLFY